MFNAALRVSHPTEKWSLWEFVWHTDLLERHQLLIIHSVVYGLFSDIVSISDYVALNGRTIDE
jgi:hypothetical protein